MNAPLAIEAAAAAAHSTKHPNLAAAMAAAQAVMGPVPKSGLNPAFKTPDHPKGRPYSTLLDVIETIRAPLTSNGVTWSQKPTRVGGVVKVTTILKHETGEKDESELEIPCEDKAAQKIGTAISYARRYGLMAMCGLASEDDDDDGNAISEPQHRHVERERAPERGAIEPPSQRIYTEEQLKKYRRECADLTVIAGKLLDKKSDEVIVAAGLPTGVRFNGEQLSRFRRWLIQSIEINRGVLPEWALTADPYDQRPPAALDEPA